MKLKQLCHLAMQCRQIYDPEGSKWPLTWTTNAGLFQWFVTWCTYTLHVRAVKVLFLGIQNVEQFHNIICESIKYFWFQGNYRPPFHLMKFTFIPNTVFNYVKKQNSYRLSKIDSYVRHSQVDVKIQQMFFSDGHLEHVQLLT